MEWREVACGKGNSDLIGPRDQWRADDWNEMGISMMHDVEERDDDVALCGCKYVEYSVNILLSDIPKNMPPEHHNK